MALCNRIPMQQIDTPPKFQNICTEGDHLNCLFVTVLRKNRHGDMSLVVCLAAWKKKNTIGKLKKSRVRNLAGIIIKYNLIDIYITRFFAVHIVLELLNLYTYKYALRSLKYILLKAFFVNNISKLQCEWLSRDQIYSRFLWKIHICVTSFLFCEQVKELKDYTSKKTYLHV